MPCRICCHHPIYDFQKLTKTLRCCQCPEIHTLDLGMKGRKRSIYQSSGAPQQWDPSYVQYRPSL